MDLSGLIFVALALVWGVVLIPKALRAHDDAARTRSVEASSDDARVLSRPGREAAPVTPQPGPARPDAPVADTADTADDHGVVRTAVAQQRHRAAAAARRRRRVLGLLLLATVAVGAASAIGALAPWAAAVPGATVVGFLVLARVLVRREHAAWAEALHRLRSADSVPSASAQDEIPSAPEPAREPELHVVARNDQGVAVVSDSEDTSAFDAALLAEAVGGPSGTLWDPLPVTLPTYVTKPRATRSVRTIDLAGPGVSSSGHDAADTALVAGTAGPEEQEPPEQRAVGS